MQAVDFIDYYAELGVPRDAPQEDISKAYKQLARKYHPDVNKEKGAEDRFKRVAEAHEVLKDPDKRKKYDRFGQQWKNASERPPQQPGRGGFGGGAQGTDFEELLNRVNQRRRAQQQQGGPQEQAGGFSDFFEAIFGRGGPGFQGAAGMGGAPIEAGEDVDARFALSLEEALSGGEREIKIEDAGTKKTRALRINIPRGVKSGQKIRLKGQGGKGVGGAPSGDLFLHIEHKPHASFRIEDDDLHTVVSVAPWTATLGGEAKLKMLDATVMLKIPAGSSSGRKVRMKGKGWPTGTDTRGDLYVEVRVVVPTELTDKERALWESLRDNSKFAPEET